MVRISLLDFGDLAQIHVQRTVRDELDIVKPHHPDAVPVDRRVARRDVNDRLAQCLPDGSAPSGVKGAHHLLAAIGWRPRGEPERIGRMDTAGESGGKIWHRTMKPKLS